MILGLMMRDKLATIPRSAHPASDPRRRLAGGGGGGHVLSLHRPRRWKQREPYDAHRTIVDNLSRLQANATPKPFVRANLEHAHAVLTNLHLGRSRCVWPVSAMSLHYDKLTVSEMTSHGPENASKYLEALLDDAAVWIRYLLRMPIKSIVALKFRLTRVRFAKPCYVLKKQLLQQSAFGLRHPALLLTSTAPRLQ